MRKLTTMITMTTMITLLKPATAKMADMPATIDVEDPVDRRAFEVPSPAESPDLSPSWRAAKKAEARAMLRWFEAKLAMVKFEVEKQAIEHKFNEANYARLRSIPGAVAGISLLEAEKRTELDDLITKQLQTMKEMAEADVAAARARLESVEVDQATRVRKRNPDRGSIRESDAGQDGYRAKY